MTPWRTVRPHLFWALLFVAALVGRAALDAFSPTDDFQGRSAVTTYLAIAIWAAAGFASSWRTGGLRSAAVGGLVAGSLAFVVNVPAVAALIGVIYATNNASAWAGIQSSGGFGEMFVMPAVVLVPAILIATIGGSAALVLRRVRR